VLKSNIDPVIVRYHATIETVIGRLFIFSSLILSLKYGFGTVKMVKIIFVFNPELILFLSQ